jgi:hypothetical protein
MMEPLLDAFLKIPARFRERASGAAVAVFFGVFRPYLAGFRVIVRKMRFQT